MKSIPVGTAHIEALLVTPEVCIDFLGTDEARVLSTPHMIGFMEIASRNLLLPYLAENEDSVGTIVDVKHLAATPVGLSVQFTAVVTSVDDRRVTFRVEARDEAEVVGEGVHERFVIDIPRFAARLAAKRAKA